MVTKSDVNQKESSGLTSAIGTSSQEIVIRERCSEFHG